MFGISKLLPGVLLSRNKLSSCHRLLLNLQTVSFSVEIAPDADKKSAYYVTTPIYYANGAPHLGHLYTSVSADMIARFQRLKGKEVHFVTGTDDHGQKVQQAAAKNNQTPLEFTNKMASQFEELGRQFNISNTDFIRTTSDRHKEGVVAMWKRLEDQGYIYKGMYEGWYSVRDECFYSEDELVHYENSDVKSSESSSTTGVVEAVPSSTPVVPISPRYCSPESGDEVSWVQEESYFFKLSAFSRILLEHYETNPCFIAPVSKRNEVISFIKGTKPSEEGEDISEEDAYNLKDLSISRTSFSWGIPVPSGADPRVPAHVIYVWMDALMNYLSALGLDETCFDASGFVGNDMLDRVWPADVHIMGKDILRFHAVYWPAFLLAAGVPLPKSIFAHGWWVMNGQKMSKSIGNVTTPADVLSLYGHDNTDYVRYFLLSEIVFGNDGDYNPQAFVHRVNSNLANDYGNLIQRSASMINKHAQGVVPTFGSVVDTPEDVELLAMADSCVRSFDTHMNSLNLYQAVEEISRLCRACNKYFDTAAPWKLAKMIDNSQNQGRNCNTITAPDNDIVRFYKVLAMTTEFIRRIAVLYSCVIPASSAKIFALYGTPDVLQTWASIQPGFNGYRDISLLLPEGPIQPIFPRIVVPVDNNSSKYVKTKKRQKAKKKADVAGL